MLMCLLPLLPSFCFAQVKGAIMSSSTTLRSEGAEERAKDEGDTPSVGFSNKFLSSKDEHVSLEGNRADDGFEDL